MAPRIAELASENARSSVSPPGDSLDHDLWFEETVDGAAAVMSWRVDQAYVFVRDDPSPT